MWLEKSIVMLKLFILEFSISDDNELSIVKYIFDFRVYFGRLWNCLNTNCKKKYNFKHNNRSLI